MLQTKNSLYKALLIVNLICLLVGVLAMISIIVGPTANIYMRISGIFVLLALVFAAYYILMGYQKADAKFYKLFQTFFGFAQLVAILDIGITVGEYLPVLISCLLFGLFIYMVLIKNLGKQRSQILCLVIFVLSVLDLLAGVSKVPCTDMYGTLVLIRNIAKILLTIMFCIMTYAKYLDKAARGTT